MYCTKSPIAATLVGVVFCMNNCVAAGSIGTSIATAGGASIANEVPNEAALNRNGAPDELTELLLFERRRKCVTRRRHDFDAVTARRDQWESKYAGR